MEHRTVQGRVSVFRGVTTFMVVFVVAMIVRVVYGLELRQAPMVDVLMGDSKAYADWARRIAAGDWVGREVFYQAPLYPYFLATLFTLFGDHLGAIRLVQVLIGSGSCAVLALAGRAFLGSAAGWMAGLMLAFYAPATFHDLLVNKTVLDGLFMALVLLGVGQLTNRWRRRWCGLIGVTLGLFALTRENALILMPFLVIWMLWYFRNEPLRSRMTGVAFLVVGWSIPLGPVGVRNWVIGGTFLPTTSQLGPNFYIGNNPNADGYYQPIRKWRAEVNFERTDAREVAEAAAGRSLTPAEVSRYWLAGAMQFIRDRPNDWLRLMIRKWLITWNATETTDTESIEAYQEWSYLLRGLGWFAHFGTLCPLAVYGLWRGRRRIRELSVVVGLVLCLAASVALFFVFGRYRYPMVPALMILASGVIFRSSPRGGQTSSPCGPNQAVGRLGPWGGEIPGLIAMTLAAVLSNGPSFAQVDAKAITYTNVAGTLLDRGDTQGALNLLERALESSPGLAEANWVMGRAYAAELRWSDAERCFRQALEFHSDLPEVHAKLALTLHRQGRLQVALVHYQQAAELDRTNASAWARWGAALAEARQFRQALLAMKESIRLAPDQPDFLYQLGNLQVGMELINDAESSFRQALALQPDHVQALNNLGVILARSRRFAEAEKMMKEAIRVNPAHAVSYNNLANLLIDQGDHERALPLLERALELDPDYEQARSTLERLRKK